RKGILDLGDVTKPHLAAHRRSLDDNLLDGVSRGALVRVPHEDVTLASLEGANRRVEALGRDGARDVPDAQAEPRQRRLVDTNAQPVRGEAGDRDLGDLAVPQ